MEFKEEGGSKESVDDTREIVTVKECFGQSLYLWYFVNVVE